jgi:Ca-activated chloride channel family protein
LIDTSGSMSGKRLNSAKKAALTFLENLGDPDQVSLITFSNQVSWIEKTVPLKENRKALEKRIKTLFASGKTSLYDAIGQAYQYMLDNPTPDRITAVVVLSDGEDTSSKMKMNTLMEKVEFHPEKKSIRVFPIGYGKEADQKILEKIAQTAEATAYEGDVDNIEDIFKDIATFF